MIKNNFQMSTVILFTSYIRPLTRKYSLSSYIEAKYIIKREKFRITSDSLLMKRINRQID